MNSLLLYILKATIGISFLYGVFRLFMRKETFFALNRTILLTIVLCATIIPLITLPSIFQSFPKSDGITTIQYLDLIANTTISETQKTISYHEVAKEGAPIPENEFSWIKLIQYIYLAGVSISIILLIYGIGSVLILFRKAKIEWTDDYGLLIVERSVSPFSFGRFVIISREDYESNCKSILAHEREHILLNHFLDLALLEALKIAHWFNPFIYWLIRDMKEVHEFQADENTINSGIDAKQYQLLIIQKSVGSHRFALINSFNHCQIKNRITMINKEKTGKAHSWKIVTFIPLLALLLMAFSKTNENVSFEQHSLEQQWTAADFGKTTNDNSENLKALLATPIEINSQSEISIQNNPTTLENITAIAKMNFDYSLADERLKNEFIKININGKEKMVQRYNILYVLSHAAASPYVQQGVLNAIGRAAEDTRQNYALELFKISYKKLPPAQKSDIDRLVPAIVVVQTFPVGPPVSKGTVNSFTAEIKAEGIIIPPAEKAIQITELKKQIENFAAGKSNPMVNIKIANGINDDLLNLVKETLITIKNLNISYSKFEPVYFLVDEMPEFPGGVKTLKNWVRNNTRYPKTSKKIEGKVYVSFVVNSLGKVESPKIEKGLNPELDAEALRVVSTIPHWIPGKQNRIPVGVKYTIPVNFALKE